jgi:hypothetical protein
MEFALESVHKRTKPRQVDFDVFCGLLLRSEERMIPIEYPK